MTDNFDYATKHLSSADYRLSKVIDRLGLIEIENIKRKSTPFQFLINEIVGQMISSKARNAIFTRLMILCKYHLTPQCIEQISDEKLRSIGVSNKKITYIKNLATTILREDLDFTDLDKQDDNEIIKKLTSIKGVGLWTAKMYLLFYLQREDVLPYEDGAFLQAYKWLYETQDTTPSKIQKQCDKWKPYSSIAARYLYKALDTGLTKISIQMFLRNQ